LQERFIFEAEHDIIYSHVEVEKVSKEDAKTLEMLGWHEDTDVEVWAYFT